MSSLNPIPRSARRQDLVAAPGQAAFQPSNFKVYDPLDVRVRSLDSVTRRYTTLTSGFVVTLAGAAPAAPVVTFSVPRAGGDVIRIEGARTPERTTDVTLGGSIRSVPLEAELDKTVMFGQETRRDLGDADGLLSAAGLLLSEVKLIVDGLLTLGPINAQTGSGPLDLTGKVIVGLAGAAALNGAAINAAMAFLSLRGSGEVKLPDGTIWIDRPLDNRFDRILVTGGGRDITHDAFGGTSGTVIRSTVPGDVLRHRTPTAAERGVSPAINWKTTGGGFRDLRVIGGTRALHVTSVVYGIHDISVLNCTGTEAVLYDTLPDYNTPAASQVAENSNNQKNTIRLDVRQDGSGEAGSATCACVVFDGTVDCSNTSYNFNIDLDIVHKNGIGLAIKNADNNIFSSFRSYRIPGGTAQPVNIRAGIPGCPTEANTFLHYTANAQAYVEGMADRPGAILPGQMFIHYIDRANGAIAPTGGSDALIVIDSDLGISTGRSLTRAVIAGSVNEAAQARARQGSESLRLWSGGANHLILDDGTIVWGVSIEPSSGNLRFLRQAGTGAVDLGGAPVRFGPLVNAANDSAAASAGVALQQVYRNGSALMIRVV